MSVRYLLQFQNSGIVPGILALSRTFGAFEAILADLGRFWALSGGVMPYHVVHGHARVLEAKDAVVLQEAADDEGLTLVHFSAQLEPFLTLNTP
jgi:hypothetical protein